MTVSCSCLRIYTPLVFVQGDLIHVHADHLLLDIIETVVIAPPHLLGEDVLPGFVLGHPSLRLVIKLHILHSAVVADPPDPPGDDVLPGPVLGHPSLGPVSGPWLSLFENHAKTYIYLCNFEDKIMQTFVFCSLF